MDARQTVKFPEGWEVLAISYVTDGEE